MKAVVVAAVLAAFSFGVQASDYNHARTVILCDSAEDYGRLAFKFKGRLSLDEMVDYAEKKRAENEELRNLSVRALKDGYSQPTAELAGMVARMRCMERRLTY